jgi:hypothetical protein
MAYKSKIRFSIGWVYPIGIFSSYILLLLEFEIRRRLREGGIILSDEPYITIILVAVMFLVLGIIQWFRYRSWIYPVLGFLVCLTTAQGSFLFPHYSGPGILAVTYFISFFLIVLFVIINWNSFYSHERFEANSRRLFRLASERIYQVDNGYTERPYSGGRVECMKEELLGFARYLQGNYIVRAFYYDTNVCLSFSMNKSLVVINEASQVSNVRIGYDGSIVVKISDRDYRDYHEKLSFDKLCASMAEIFVRFLGYYRSGLESRIITELKAAR